MVRESGAGVGRSTAIVVFTDLVGSTELRSRLGEDAAEELRRNHDRLIAGAIEANRGRLVKNLGDGVMATFTGASDALGAAVGIQQALDRHNRSGSSDVPLEVRIGISAGDVAFEEADCFGTPVIEAARLCAAAGGGTILVTEVVRLLAGTVGGHQFAPAGVLELKGLPAPVSAWEVTWAPLPGPILSMPALLSGAGRIFVGRDEELDRLLRLWKEVMTGERRVALLAGEPGIGKTRLAVEVAGCVRESGGVVLAGRCDEDLGVPYQPLVEALRHYVTGAENRRLGRYGGELTRLVPELTELVSGLSDPLRSDPDTERYRLFDAVAAWLADVSAETPVFLVLDDLHWATKPTLLLLRHVLRSPEPLRLLVAATYRDSEVDRSHPLSELLTHLHRIDGVERFPLGGLCQPAVKDFIEQAAGRAFPEGDDALPRAVWMETEGNPFFVAQVLRHLRETGGVEQRAGHWVITVPVEELGIPEGVRDVVGRRLSRLSEGTQQALQVASVVGLEFESGVVQAAADLGDPILFSALEEAVGARLLIDVPGPTPRYRFAHALVGATLYDELTAARRVTLHQRVAEATETIHDGALDDYIPALAHHWARARAGAGETRKAVDYATQAGDRAIGQLAHDEGVAYYRQALELLGRVPGPSDDGQRLELLIALGDAQRRAADPASQQTLLEAVRLARARNDTDALARAALANTRGLYWSSVWAIDHDRVGTLEAALAAVGQTPTAVRARLLATLGLELVWAPDRARRVRLSDEALRIARSLGDDATLAHVLVTRAWTINAPDTLAERMASAAELISLAADLGDPLVEFIAHFLRARVGLESGDVDGNHLQRARDLAAELGQPTLRFMAAWVTVGHLLMDGRIDEADRAAQRALEIGEASGQPDALLIFTIQRSVIRFHQSRLGELVPELSDMSIRVTGVPGLAVLVAAAHIQLGRDDEARNSLRTLSVVSFKLPRDPLYLGFLTVAADVACHLDDQVSAGLLYELLEPYPTVVGVLAAAGTGCAAHYLGRLAATLGRHTTAEEHFRAAAGVHERINAAVWLAATHLEWARMLLTRRRPGDGDRARELLGQTLTTARELGLANVERQAVHLLT